MADPDLDNFGAALRRRRRSAGLTQHELAERAGVSERTVRSWESEHTHAPRTASLRQIQLALDSLTKHPPQQVTTLSILGPLRLHVGGAAVTVPGRNAAALLGLLALHANTPVSRDTIIDAVWGEQPPASVVNLVQSCVTNLRRLLGASIQLISTSRGSYQLIAGEQQLDASRFTALAELATAARTARELERAHELYAACLDCWTGAVLADLDQRLRQHPAAVALTAHRRAIARAYATLALELGHPEYVVTRLRPLVEEEPLYEGLYAPLILALAGTGQQAKALTLFDRLRTRLRDELGVEPNPEVREAHLRVLRGTATLRPDVAWNCLPRDIGDFTGRHNEIRSILAPTKHTAPRITTIEGMAGVGKTALATHLAHRLTVDYPDGQLFVDLQAHSEGHDPLTPRDALESLLRQLAIEGERIPERLDDCSALWRAYTAQRRLLIILDNALDAAQLRPLLPSGNHSWTFITSRTRLTSLEGTRRIFVDVLPRTDAAKLFTTVLGQPVAGEEDTVQEILQLCGFLPLALRIAAARTTGSLARLSTKLTGEHRRLTELRAGDRGVEAAIALSYRHLGAAQQRLFRVLAEAPGADIDLLATAALADLPAADTEDLLEDLLNTHLLFEPRPGRYHFHDLVRQYARSIADDSREKAREQVTNYYLHAAVTAADLLEPTRKRFPLPGPPAQLPDFTTEAHALEWLDTESGNLVATITDASARGRYARCWQLAQTLWRFFFIRGHLRDWTHTHRLALDAARQLGDETAQAETHKNLGLAYWRASSSAEALEHHHHALALDERHGDIWGQAKTHNHFGFIYGRIGNHAHAIRHQNESARLYRQAGDHCGEARALVGLGNAHYHAGDLVNARTHFTDALALARKVGDTWGEGLALLGLGYVCEDTGRPYLDQALTHARAIGDHWSESLALTGLGIHHHRTGAITTAMEHLQQGVHTARRTGDRWGLRLALSSLANLLTDKAQYPEALQVQEEALALARALNNPFLEAEVLTDLTRTRTKSASHFPRSQ